MQRGARFLILGNRSMVQHGLSEGVKNIYKTNAILHILKMKASPGAATKTSPKNKNSKQTLKINVWCDRLGRSLVSTWADPFFGVHKVGAPVDLHKCSKTV